MRTQKLNRYIALALMLGMVMGCTEKAEIREKVPLHVSTYEVSRATENQLREFKGKVMPAELTDISFRIAGELDSVLVRSGQKVEKGQLLATLNAGKLRQRLADAEVRFQLSEKQLQRGKELFAMKMLSQSELDSLTASRSVAQVTYKQAQNQLEYARLVAPFAGVISEVPKKSFESVKEGETILSIYQSDTVQVRITISDAVLAMIDPDSHKRDYQPKVVFSNDKREFRMRYLDHSSEQVPESRSYEIWLQMDQVEPAILPGTSANVVVDMAETGLPQSLGYEIPMTALDPGDKAEQFFVWKLQDGKVQKAAVEVSRIANSGAIIRMGIGKGEELVNSNLSKLRNGVEVFRINKEKSQ